MCHANRESVRDDVRDGVHGGVFRHDCVQRAGKQQVLPALRPWRLLSEFQDSRSQGIQLGGHSVLGKPLQPVRLQVLRSQ